MPQFVEGYTLDITLTCWGRRCCAPGIVIVELYIKSCNGSIKPEDGASRQKTPRPAIIPENCVSSVVTSGSNAGSAGIAKRKVRGNAPGCRRILHGCSFAGAVRSVFIDSIAHRWAGTRPFSAHVTESNRKRPVIALVVPG